MKVYTRKEFDQLEQDEYGWKICPSGDYSGIRNFPEWCIFGKGCSFGEWCIFGKGCSFGERCSFGEESGFGEQCSFGKGCSFGERCSFCKGCSFGEQCGFGEWCSFGRVCNFGEWCSFGEESNFGERCSFGEKCFFGEECSFENGRVKNGRFFACDRIGSGNWKTYFFADGENKMFVRDEFFFGTLDEFIAEVKESHGGTKYERQYLSAVDLAKIVLLG